MSLLTVGLRAYGWSFAKLPRRLREGWISLVAKVAMVLPLRRRVEEGMVRFFGSSKGEVVRRHLHFLVRFLHKFLLMRYLYRPGRDEMEVEVEGKEFLREAIGKGKGVIFVTAHQGDFFSSVLYLSSFIPLSIVVRRAKDASLEEMVEDTRRLWGIKSIYSERAPLGARSALKAKEGVVFFLDQYLFPELSHRRAKRVLANVSFLGSKMGVPILPFFAREGGDGRAVVRFYPPLKEGSPQEMRGVMEGEIRELPHLWFWWMRMGKRRRKRDVFREGRRG